RIAKLSPGVTVPVVVIGRYRRSRSSSPCVRDRLMSDSETRAELFAAIEALAGIIPDMRGGQLMAAVGELCADLHGRCLWDAEDAELLEAVWQFRRSFETATVPQRAAGAESKIDATGT